MLLAKGGYSVYVSIPIQATYTVQDSDIVYSHYTYVHAETEVVARHIAQAVCVSTVEQDQGGDTDGSKAGYA